MLNLTLFLSPLLAELSLNEVISNFTKDLHCQDLHINILTLEIGLNIYLECPGQIFKTDDKSSYHYGKHNIIFLDNIEDLNLYLEELELRNLQNLYEFQFLFIFVSIPNVEEVFRILLQSEIYKSNIAYKKGAEFEIYSWNALDDSSDCGHIVNPKRGFQSFSKSNFTNCPINALVEYPADDPKPSITDGFFDCIHAFQEKYRFKLTIKDDPSYFAELVRTGNHPSLYRDLRAKVFDIGFGPILSVCCDDFNGIWCSTTTATLKFMWSYPKLPLPHWKYVIIAFSKTVWISLAISLIIVAGLTTKLSNDDQVTFFWSFLVIFRVCVGGTVTNAFQKFSKIYSSAVLIFGFYISTLYISQLNGILVMPLHEKPVSTQQGLLDLHLGVEVMKSTKLMLANERLESTKLLIAEAIVSKVPTMPQILEDLVKRNDFITINSEYSLRMRSHLFEYIETLYLKTYGTVFLARRSVPYLGVLDDFLMRCKDYGLAFNWQNGTVKLRRWRKSQAVALKFAHLEGAFYLLFGGLALGTLAFIAERFNRKSTYKGCFK